MAAEPGKHLREILFGESKDLSAAQRAGAETLDLFAEARDELARGDKEAARRSLENIGLNRDLESLIRIHAWTLLRQTGGSPPTTVKNDVLGVVVEVGVEKGHDLLAGYDDRTARYYNYSGAGVVWIRPNSSLDSVIEVVLSAARAILPRMGPWESERRPPPSAGRVRLNILTPLGLHFVEGPFDALDRDRMAGPLVQAATILMAKLTSLPKS
jgi:hypothetical protein